MLALLYAVGVYVFIKHGDKKLKWYIIIPYIVVTWIVTVGVPPYLRDCGTQNAKGFCTVNLFSALYIGMAVSLIVEAMFFLSMQLICCILTFTYIKQNVLKQSPKYSDIWPLFQFYPSSIEFFLTLLQ